MAAKNNIFTQNLKKIILEAKLDNHKFAQKCGMNYSTLMTYLRPKNDGRVPEWDQLLKISVAGNKSIEWLLTGKEPQKDCAVNCDIEMQEICLKVKELIKSETSWGESLRSNIETFKKGFDNEKHIDNIRGTSLVEQKPGMDIKRRKVREYKQVAAKNVLDLTSELIL